MSSDVFDVVLLILLAIIAAGVWVRGRL